MKLWKSESLSFSSFFLIHNGKSLLHTTLRRFLATFILEHVIRVISIFDFTYLALYTFSPHSHVYLYSHLSLPFKFLFLIIISSSALQPPKARPGSSFRCTSFRARSTLHFSGSSYVPYFVDWKYDHTRRQWQVRGLIAQWWRFSRPRLQDGQV